MEVYLIIVGRTAEIYARPVKRVIKLSFCFIGGSTEVSPTLVGGVLELSQSLVDGTAEVNPILVDGTAKVSFSMVG